MSWMPVFMPCPPAGLWTCAASPPSSRRPIFRCDTMRLLTRKKDAQVRPWKRAGTCERWSHTCCSSASVGSDPFSGGTLATRHTRSPPNGNRLSEPCSEENAWKSVSGRSPSMRMSPSAKVVSSILPSNWRSSVVRVRLCAPSALISHGAFASSSAPSAWRSTGHTGDGSGDGAFCATPTSSTPRSTVTPWRATASPSTHSVSLCGTRSVKL